MKRHGQVWPSIPFKFFKLAIIIDWPDRLGLITIKYHTHPRRNTYFQTFTTARHLFGPFYWMGEHRAEVVRAPR